MNKPKLVKKWKDTEYKSEVKEYRYKNGFRVIEVINPNTVRIDVNLVVKAGAYFENQLGVPAGTAHMLEHILHSHPNRHQKTIKQVRDYQLGNKSRPSMYMNASVTKKFMYFEGSTHIKGSKRLLRSLRYRLDSDPNRFGEYLNQEKQIVQAELAGRPKLDQDLSYQMGRFIDQDTYPEHESLVIGDKDSINSITKQDLVNFFHSCFRTGNMVLSVQLPNGIDSELWEEIFKLTQLFDQNQDQLTTKKYELDQSLRVGYFREPKSQSVLVEFCYVEDLDWRGDYLNERLGYLARRSITKAAYERLRMDLQLVYAVRTFGRVQSWDWRVRGFSIQTDIERFGRMLDEYYQVFTSGVLDFLDSKDGNRWFVSTISDLVFPDNVSYDSDYAESHAIDLLHNIEYQFDYKRAQRVVKEITIDQVKQRIKSEFIEVPPIVWIVSDQEQDKIVDIFNKSAWKSYQT